MIRAFVSRALDLVFRRRRDEALSEEIQSHLDRLTDDYVARGMTPADARTAARRAFGGVEQVKEAYRDQRGLPILDALAQDVRFAVRLLRKDRAFALSAVVVLAVGIGVNNMLFTILNAHTMRGLPITAVDRVVYVSSFDDRTADRGISYPDFVDLRNAARDVVGLSAFSSAPVVLGGDQRAPDRLEGAFVSQDGFGRLGIAPILGREFSPEDDRAGATPVVILGGGTWTSRYGAAPDVLGRSILVNGAPAVVVGVMPERSGFPSTAEIWLPLAHDPRLRAQERDARTLRVFGRMRDGVSIAEARSAIESIAGRLSRDYPETNRNVRARVVPINERFLGSLTDPAWVAFTTVSLLIVLISCANVANLVLASSVRRAREMAVRTSLGASRRRMLRQLMTEGTMLAAVGGLAGLGVSMAGVRLFRSAIPENVLPYWLDYSLDARVCLALVAVSLGTVVLFALVPALQASKADVTSVLKESGPTGTSGRGAQRWSTAFLAAEFGLAVVLLANLTMSFRNSRPPVASDDAIASAQILTAVVTLPTETYRSSEQRLDFYRRLVERLRGNPAVSAVSFASVLPLEGGAEGGIDIEGRPSTAGAPATTVRVVLIAPRYFEALGLSLSRGRDFSENDGAPGHGHAIVNERLAAQSFAGEDPLGKRLSVPLPGGAAAARTWFTVVGVAPDIRQGRGPEPDAVVYLPLRTAPAPSASVLARAHRQGEDLVSLLRREVQALDANLPLYRMRSMSQVTRDAQWNGRLSARLILVLTIIAAGLSTVGLYAVTAYGVSQRTHEIGLRRALGARTSQLAALIARRVLMQLTIGFVAGILCTMLWDRTFSGGPGIRVTDPRSLAVVAAILVVLATVACAAPIRRATRLEPLTALRRAP